MRKLLTHAGNALCGVTLMFGFLLGLLSYSFADGFKAARCWLDTLIDPRTTELEDLEVMPLEPQGVEMRVQACAECGGPIYGTGWHAEHKSSCSNFPL